MTSFSLVLPTPPPSFSSSSISSSNATTLHDELFQSSLHSSSHGTTDLDDELSQSFHTFKLSWNNSICWASHGIFHSSLHSSSHGTELDDDELFQSSLQTSSSIPSSDEHKLYRMRSFAFKLWWTLLLITALISPSSCRSLFPVHLSSGFRDALAMSEKNLGEKPLQFL